MRTVSRIGAGPRGGGKRVFRLAALWAFILLSCGGLGFAGFFSMHRPPDPVARCRDGGPVEASTVVLVDTTDAMTDIQRRRLETTIADERDRLPAGGRLSVLAIRALSPDDPVEIASLCDPGKASDVNPLIETGSQVKIRFDKEFDKPLAQAIDQAGRGAPADRSPIIESMAAVLNRPDFDSRTLKRRLVVVSDMLQHRKGGYSQLKGGDLWRGYVASGLREQAPLELRGVTVAIDYLARSSFAQAQGPAHRAFWRRLLTEAGASDLTFIGRPRDDDQLTASAGGDEANAVAGAVTKQAASPTSMKTGGNRKRRRK